MAPIPSSIKFNIPAEARNFTVFSKLPVEIRQKVWEEAVFEPGMHFLRLETEAPRVLDPRDDENEQSGGAFATAPEAASSNNPAWDAQLKPLYPTPKADNSYYVTLNKMLAKLSITCEDSDAVVQRLLKQPGTLKLDNGRVVSLESSRDVICLDYLPADMFQSGCQMPMDIECPSLNLIRHVAVRYCHKWESKRVSSMCETCGQVHDHTTKKIYPTHLYQFLARYLPNLETFYFVDYLILRKADKEDEKEKDWSMDGFVGSDSKPHHMMPEPRQAGTVGCSKNSTTSSRAGFKSGGRTYYEVDGNEWAVKSNVFATLDWVKSGFTHYAEMSKSARHANPAKVHFKVLACEWAISQVAPASDIQVPTPKKGRHKRAYANVDEGGGHGRRSPPKQRHTRVEPAMAALPVQSSATFVFGQGDSFVFAFRAPRK